jgi:23S rRNA (adenine2503-C2)-methyltransferase
MSEVSFYKYPLNKLQSLFADQGINPDQARLLYNWYYKKNQTKPCSLFGLADKTKKYIDSHFHFSRPQICEIKESEDGTVKFLFLLNDQKTVETVLIPFNKKYTVCLSSQVGCAMKCAFCFTGTQGLSRNLETEEIVGQFLQVQSWLTNNRPNDDVILNIVFMGQGEPLHNFDSVKDALEIFISQYGLSLADHKITVSTSGYLPGLIRWKSEMPSVNIALSLHSPFEEKRSQLIPINKKYPLSEIFSLIESIPDGKKRFVTYEYLLIDGFNDSDEDALATAQMLVNTKAFVNLIPFNPFPGTAFKRPQQSRIESFFKIIQEHKIPVTLRTTKGDQILAACGQLNTKNSMSHKSK